MSSQAFPRRSLLTSRSNFLIGYHQQQEWRWLIATAFFLGKVGGGLFMISFFSDFKLGALVGLGIVGIGKSTAHLLYLGRPERFLRAGLRWQTSWISRGILAMTVFVAFGAVYVAPYIHIGFVPDGVAKGFGIAAIPFAFVVMAYDGMVLKASKGIPLWDTWLMPVLMLFYATLAGITATLALEVIDGAATSGRLEGVEIGLAAINVLLLAGYVVLAKARGAAAELGTTLLRSGTNGKLFAAAIVVGLGVTFVLGVVGAAADSRPLLVIAAVTDLFGHFFVFFAILRAGVHAPIRRLPLRPEPASPAAATAATVGSAFRRAAS